MAGDEAIIRREGDRLIIEPIRKGGLMSVLAKLAPLEEPADHHYAALRAHLERKGQIIGPNCSSLHTRCQKVLRLSLSIKESFLVSQG